MCHLMGLQGAAIGELGLKDKVTLVESEIGKKEEVLRRKGSMELKTVLINIVNIC